MIIYQIINLAFIQKQALVIINVRVSALKNEGRGHKLLSKILSVWFTFQSAQSKGIFLIDPRKQVQIQTYVNILQNFVNFGL